MFVITKPPFLGSRTVSDEVGRFDGDAVDVPSYQKIGTKIELLKEQNMTFLKIKQTKELN